MAGMNTVASSDPTIKPQRPPPKKGRSTQLDRIVALEVYLPLLEELAQREGTSANNGMLGGGVHEADANPLKTILEQFHNFMKPITWFTRKRHMLYRTIPLLNVNYSWKTLFKEFMQLWSEYPTASRVGFYGGYIVENYKTHMFDVFYASSNTALTDTVYTELYPAHAEQSLAKVKSALKLSQANDFMNSRMYRSAENSAQSVGYLFYVKMVLVFPGRNYGHALRSRVSIRKNRASK